jgi:hypothetical protein
MIGREMGVVKHLSVWKKGLLYLPWTPFLAVFLVLGHPARGRWWGGVVSHAAGSNGATEFGVGRKDLMVNTNKFPFN